MFATQYATTKVSFQYAIVHPSNADIRFVGSDNSSADGLRVLRVSGDNGSNAKIGLEFGNWSANMNTTYTAAFAIVNEEGFAVNITHVTVTNTSGTSDYMQVWLHGNGSLMAENDPTSVFVYNNGSALKTASSVSWQFAKGDGDVSTMYPDISDGATMISTGWDESAHVRYTQNLSGGNDDAFPVGSNGRTLNNASDFVWVQISINVPAGAVGGPHAGTIEVHFAASSHLQSAAEEEGGGCPCADGDTDNGDGTCTATIYAESTDGYIVGESDAYATARATSSYDVTDTNFLGVGQEFDGDNYFVIRGYLEFDTSGIDDDAEIEDVNLTLTVNDDESGTTFNVNIHKCTWTSPITAGNRESNYDTALTSTLDQIWRNTNGIIGTPYTSPSLDTTWVSKTGLTQYALLSARDVAATQPSGTEYILVYPKEAATQAYRPYLTIKYTPSCSPFLYTFNDSNYKLISDFIPGATAPEKEYVHSIDITRKTEIVEGTVRVKIAEKLPETTYIDQIYLQVDENNRVEPQRIIPCGMPWFSDDVFHGFTDALLLRHSDNQYLQLHQGDGYILEFSVPENSSKIEFVAEGYYIKNIT